jgi:multiple sugar transport system permease protein
MPPIAVAIPIFLMYRTLGLLRHVARPDPALHRVNISLAVWLLKGSSTRSRASTRRPR